LYVYDLVVVHELCVDIYLNLSPCYVFSFFFVLEALDKQTEPEQNCKNRTIRELNKDIDPNVASLMSTDKPTPSNVTLGYSTLFIYCNPSCLSPPLF